MKRKTNYICYLCASDEDLGRVQNIVVCQRCELRWMPQPKVAHPTDAELPKITPDLGFLDYSAVVPAPVSYQYNLKTNKWEQVP